MTDETGIALSQKRVCKIAQGDWLPNLGKVAKILISGDRIRFYFDNSASREFEISDIVYVDAGNRQRMVRHTVNLPEGKNPARRQRPTAINGVSID